MGWLDGFPFQNKEDKRRKQKAFEARALPFGEAGREKALATLRALSSNKLDDSELLWPYFTAKDAYEFDLADGAEEKDALVKAWLSIDKTMRMKREDRLTVLALVKLEHGLESLEDYPAPNMVKATALGLESGL